MNEARRRAMPWKSLLLLAAVTGGLYYWYSMRAASERTTPELATPIIIAKGEIEEVVTAQGKLEPREYVDVGAQVSGQLKRIHVEIGDVVHKGDLLAEIDPRVYESRVQADEARLRTLRAQLAEQTAQIKLAQQIFARNRRLIAEQAISQEVLEDSDTSLQVARARAESLKAQIEEAEFTLDGDRTNLGYTRIFAPMDGTVVLQSSREGQTLNAAQQAPVIVQLANLDQMTVRAQIAEADVMRITPDLGAYFTTLGAMEERWQGKVREVLPSPEVINEVVLYNALIDVDNRDRRLMTGMSVQLFFVLGRATDVPVIPISALRERLPKEDDARGEAYQVLVKAGETTAPRTVHLGLRNRQQAAVTDGLAPGDAVVPPTAAVDPSTSMPRFPPRI